MELRQIRYFAAVAKAKSISKAAPKLGISQPTLSVAIRKLEEDVGVSLFLRRGKSFELSEAGAVFLKKVVPAIEEIDSAKELARKTVNKKDYTIGFTSASVATHWALVKELDKLGADLTIAPFTNMTSEMLYSALTERKMDVCISVPPISGPGLITQTIGAKELFAILPKRHPLAERESINLSELANERFAAPPDKSLSYEALLEKCRLAGFVPNVGYNHMTLYDAFMAVASGDFVSLHGYPYDEMEVFLEKVAAVKINYPDCTTYLGLAWREEDSERPLVKKISETIIKYFKEHK